MYQVLARKWRPRIFAELVGQQHVSKTLCNAVESDRLAHAYIFAGLRGTGKTTVARILAKCLNCEKGPTTSPCGTCAACEEIAESRAMDVLEIDAASRTKVEQTRELLEMVSYAPVRDRYKILIIDEAHMLSKASFNALLKTLEEPPPNVMFILATTELQKIIPTILSRCQVFEFRRVGSAELAGYLRTICDDEKIEISDTALGRLARAGEGSVRDSLSVLERVLAFSGNKVHDEDVLRALGAVRIRVLTELMQSLAARDASGMLTVLDSLVDEGHDLVHFWSELIAAIRDLLLLRALPDRKEMLTRSPDEAEALAGAAEGLSAEDLTRVFQIVADLEYGLKSSSQPRFLFEAALIRLADLGAVRPIEEFLGTLSAAPQPRQKKKLIESPRTQAPAPAAAPAVAPSAPAPSAAPAAPAPSAAASGFHGDLLEAVRQARPMVGAMLEQAGSLTVVGSHLRVQLPAGMDAVKRHLERKDSRALLEEQATKLTGTKLQAYFELGDVTTEASKPAPPSTPATPTPAASATPETPATPSPTSTVPPITGTTDDDGLLADVRKEPGVRSLLDVFGAHVVDIKPLDRKQEPRPKPGPPSLEDQP